MKCAACKLYTQSFPTVVPPTVSSLLYIVPPCTCEQSGIGIKNTKCKHCATNSARKYQARVCAPSEGLIKQVTT